MNESKTKPYLICLTGLTGCGKTTTKNMFSMHIGIKTFYTKELHSIILGKQAKNIHKMDVSTLLPNKNDFIKKIMTHISKTKNDADIIVLDSIRSTDELEYIKTLSEYKSVFLIRVMCNEKIRIERLKKRDLCDEKTIYKRDLRDIGKDGTNMFNMNELFKKANFVINTSGTFKDIKKQIVNILLTLTKTPQKYNTTKNKYLNSLQQKSNENQRS